MKARLVTVKLTTLEAQVLHAMADNGWGSGDFADGDMERTVACESALAKLQTARERVPAKNPAAVALGSIKSPKKAATSAANGRRSAEEGKKGGRPRKTPKPSVATPVGPREA